MTDDHAMIAEPAPDRTAAVVVEAEMSAAELRHARKTAFIAALAAGHSAIDAAQESGIGWRKAYVWRAEDAHFRAAWNRARDQIRFRRIPEPPLPPPICPPLHEIEVPPSPPLDETGLTIHLITLPAASVRNLQVKARPGDKVVLVAWSFSWAVADDVTTFTVRHDGSYARDAETDWRAYQCVEPEDRPISEAPEFVFIGPEGTALRPADDYARPGDRVLRITGALHSRDEGWHVLACDERRIGWLMETKDVALYDAALAARPELVPK
jgi:hypothetical protein